MSAPADIAALAADPDFDERLEAYNRNSARFVSTVVLLQVRWRRRAKQRAVARVRVGAGAAARAAAEADEAAHVFSEESDLV
jgi:hypothetical protein